MSSVVAFDPTVKGKRKKREKELDHFYTDRFTGDVIDDPKCVEALDKMNLLYDSYVALAKKSRAIMDKFGIE